MIDRAGRAMTTLIESDGAKAALTPATHNFDKERLVSLWSHKHLRHLIGLCRYGTNCQFITPAGCSGRMDRAACYARLRENYHLLMASDGLPDSTAVCAKC